MLSPRPESIDPTPLSAVSTAAGPVTELVADAVAGGVTVTGVTLSTFSVRPGDLYAGLPGANVHGASYAAKAIDSGAVAVLTDEAGRRIIEGLTAEGEQQPPMVVVPDPRAVLARVAATVYGTALPDGPGVRTYGITGTNGKTTTAYLLTSALRALGRTTGLIGTVETTIGEERATNPFLRAADADALARLHEAPPFPPPPFTKS